MRTTSLISSTGFTEVAAEGGTIVESGVVRHAVSGATPSRTVSLLDFTSLDTPKVERSSLPEAGAPTVGANRPTAAYRGLRRAFVAADWTAVNQGAQVNLLGVPHGGRLPLRRWLRGQEELGHFLLVVDILRVRSRQRLPHCARFLELKGRDVCCAALSAEFTQQLQALRLGLVPHSIGGESPGEVGRFFGNALGFGVLGRVSRGASV